MTGVPRLLRVVSGTRVTGAIQVNDAKVTWGTRVAKVLRLTRPPHEGMRNRCVQRGTRSRCAEVETVEGCASQGLREGGEAPAQEELFFFVDL